MKLLAYGITIVFVWIQILGFLKPNNGVLAQVDLQPPEGLMAAQNKTMGVSLNQTMEQNKTRVRRQGGGGGGGGGGAGPYPYIPYVYPYSNFFFNFY